VDTSSLVAASREQRRHWAERFRRLESIDRILVARSVDALAQSYDLLRRAERTLDGQRRTETCGIDWSVEPRAQPFPPS
jgi:hypothetical protein